MAGTQFDLEPDGSALFYGTDANGDAFEIGSFDYSDDFGDRFCTTTCANPPISSFPEVGTYPAYVVDITCARVTDTFEDTCASDIGFGFTEPDNGQGIVIVTALPDTVPISSPEPSSFLLAGMGMLALIGLGRLK